MTSDDIVAVGGEGEALCARAICRDPITCRDDCRECADRHGPPVPPGALCQRCLQEIDHKQVALFARSGR